MAESSDVSALKVFNYICGSGRVLELSHLLRPPSPLAKKSTVTDVIKWFQKHSDPNNGLFLVRNQHGRAIGMRIILKKQMCLKYATAESCKQGPRCKFWHLCKEFIEGRCNGNCGRSHDFHDKDNKAKIAELGFEGKPNASLRNIVAGSFPQVCLLYLQNECGSENCPYLHICANAVRAAVCECNLSHDFADPNNKSIMDQYGFKPPRTSQMDVVRCNILVPKQQKPFEASANQSLGRPLPLPRGNDRPGFSAKNQAPSHVNSGPVSLADLCHGYAKGEVRAPANVQMTMHHKETLPSSDDPLSLKVFKYICGIGGLSSLQGLLRHPSPLAKKFPNPEQELDAKIWLQVQALPEQGQKIILMENQAKEIVGARVNSRTKLCLHYPKGHCKSLNTCQFWHVCKGYLEGTCQGGCSLSHDFHDECNIKKIQRLGIEHHQGGTVKNIIANSFPQVCLLYLKNECISSPDCPYLHLCSLAVQGNPCSCDLSHDLNDDHNTAILKQYNLDPQKTKHNIMQCNILIPKKQKSLADGKLVSASPSLPSQPVPLMSLPVAPQGGNNLGSQPKATSEKKQKQKKKARRRKKKNASQVGEPCEEPHADDVEDESSDSVSDNEDVLDKPDLYSSSKFVADPSPYTWQESMSKNPLIPGQAGKEKKDTMPKKHPANKGAHLNRGSTDYEQVSGMGTNEAAEGNLINLSDEPDDDWQDLVDFSLDDFSTFEPLSQVDDLLFNLSPSNVTGSLSQESTLSEPSNEHSSESHPEKDGVRSVFQYICTEHNGEVPFAAISQCHDLFPSHTIDIAEWFRVNSNRFMIIENSAGEIESVRTYSPKARICFRYLMTKKGCKDPKCFRYHVCKHYLANGACPFGKKCHYSHSHNLKSSHNKHITRKLRLNSFSEDQLRVLISASVPEVCLDYNKSGRCKRGLRCHGIHVCKYFVMGNCKRGTNCPLSHEASLKDPHANLVLGRYNLTSVPPQAVFRALLVRGLRPPSTMETVEEQEAEPTRQKSTKQLQSMHSPQYICLDFLLGHCSKQQLCDHYHYSIPYMWQYKHPSDDQPDSWKAFEESENDAIERQFSDVNVTIAEMEHIMVAPPPTVLIDPGEGHIKVNFDEMTAKTGFGHVQLRRLSTKSAISPTDHALSTQWVWYWLDQESSWGKYDSELMERMEVSFSKGAPFFRFKVGGEDYKLFFKKSPMYQQSTKPPINIKRVRRRPVFRSKSDAQNLQSPLELPVPLKPETPHSPVTSAPGRAPSHWTSVPDDVEFIRVPLPSTSDDFKLAESLFRRSMSENKASIVSIERFQNPFMWQKYAVKKEQMEKRASIKDSPVNEKLLFHGIDAKNVDTICEENIDWRTQDEDRAAQFGQGAYFTEEAGLSNLYCRQDSESYRYMFLAEVLVGTSAKGEPSMKRPPFKSESAAKKERYDSCVDNVEKPTIFVLFDSDQYYPSFLIKYKSKSKVVC